ncbi:glycosyltransferase [bacterium]|nr:glycosyltransferase [bacterium]
MKIGYIHPNPFPAVIANIVQIVQMCRAFAVMGHEVTLFVPRGREFTDDESALAKARELFGDPLQFRLVFVKRRTIMGRMQVLGSVWGTLKALRDHPVDLLYTRNPWSVPFLKKTGIPFVFESHDAHLHESSKLLGSLLRKWIVHTSHHPRMVKLVAISRALVKVWSELGVSPAKLISAHDAVELEMFKASMTKEDARRIVNIKDGDPIVLYTGSLKADRGMDLILDAALRLTGMRFIIIGGTRQEADALRGKAARLGAHNVLVKGSIPHKEIPHWLAAADILLMMWTWQVSTIKVCSPMKLFEYMAAKRHVVGPAFPTVLEVLEDEIDAILFEPDKLEAMISALRQAHVKLDDPAMPEAAFKKVAADYTWNARCRRILDSLPPLASLKNNSKLNSGQNSAGH